MSVCPVCSAELTRTCYCGKLCFGCRKCGGHLVTLPILKSLSGAPELVYRLFHAARFQNAPDGKLCPDCRKPMKRVAIADGDADKVEIDLCVRCQQIWFDKSELSIIPVAEVPEDPDDRVPDKAREIMALHAAQKVAPPEGICDDELGWHNLFTALGLPSEIDAPALSRLPLVTWGIALVCTVLFVCGIWSGLQRTFIEEYGFIVNLWHRHYGLTLLSGMLLHSSIWHLLGNIYFLLIFGDNVEDMLGRGKYLLFILLCEIGGTALYMLLCREPNIPCVGASGFISGIIAFYTVCFPQVRLLLASGRRYGVLQAHLVEIPVFVWFAFWIGGQIVCAFFSSANVAYSAHIGGALTGLVCGVLWRLKNR